MEAGSSGAVISGKAEGSGYKAKKAEKVKKAAATNESTPTPQYGPKQLTHLRLGSAEGREPSGLILSDDGRQLRVPCSCVSVDKYSIAKRRDGAC